MNETERAAFVIAQAACLTATVLGMQAENMQREHRGESMAFVATDFENAIRAAGVVGWNDAITYLQGGR